MSTLEHILAERGETSLAHIYDPAEYDPQQAHLYYEKHKTLKGRRPGVSKPTSSRRHGRGKVVLAKHAGKKVKPKTPEQRRKEVEARVASLKGKLARLQQILAKLVEEAKARSGVKDTATKDTKTKDASTKASSSSKLNAQQKKEAAKRSQDYRDQHKDTPDEQAAALQKKIDDVTQKIHDMRAQIADARAATSSPTAPAAKAVASKLAQHKGPDKAGRLPGDPHYGDDPPVKKK